MTKNSHVDEKISAQVLSELKQYFGDLVIGRGRKHIFGGANITIYRRQKN